MFKLIDQYDNASMFIHEKNALKLIIWPYNLAPVVGVQVTYLAGSRHEVTGITGAAHLLEHLMFKGSKKFDSHDAMNIHKLEDKGAILNATTWLDRTNYFEVLLKKDVDIAMQIEADRMVNAWLREEDRSSEMTVVRNEYERGENSAFQVLYKHVWAMSYLAHPYHHTTIGWKADIENMSIEAIQDFYHRFYGPNNAVVSVVGDITVEEGLALVEKNFGHIPALAKPVPEIYTTEDPQEGERHFVIRRKGTARWIVVSHKAPSGLEEDHLALQLLGKIISHGQMAYLHRALIDKGLAQDVYVDIHPMHDPGLFSTYVNLSVDTTPEHVMEQVLEVYENVKKGMITAEDLARAKTQLLAEKAFDKDGLMGLLQTINEGIACGDWKHGLDIAARVEKITLDDLKNVASHYLVQSQQVSGFYLPKE